MTVRGKSEFAIVEEDEDRGDYGVGEDLDVSSGAFTARGERGAGDS